MNFVIYSIQEAESSQQEKLIIVRNEEMKKLQSSNKANCRWNGRIEAIERIRLWTWNVSLSKVDELFEELHGLPHNSMWFEGRKRLANKKYS